MAQNKFSAYCELEFLIRLVKFVNKCVIGSFVSWSAKCLWETGYKSWEYLLSMRYSIAVVQAFAIWASAVGETFISTFQVTKLILENAHWNSKNDNWKLFFKRGCKKQITWKNISKLVEFLFGIIFLQFVNFNLHSCTKLKTEKIEIDWSFSVFNARFSFKNHATFYQNKSFSFKLPKLSLSITSTIRSIFVIVYFGIDFGKKIENCKESIFQKHYAVSQGWLDMSIWSLMWDSYKNWRVTLH